VNKIISKEIVGKSVFDQKKLINWWSI
jgi:hypothetical protein